jgi:hypothetical protein
MRAQRSDRASQSIEFAYRTTFLMDWFFILPSKRAAGPIAPARSKSDVEAAGNQKLTTVYFTNW